MRKVEIAVYTLPELKDVNKKGYEKALELMAELNTSDGFWHECIDDDAERMGLELKEWDTYRQNCKMDFVNGAGNTALLIINNHGEHFHTRKAANAFIAQKLALGNRPEGDGDEDSVWLDRLEILEQEFLDDLCHAYLKMLTDEYEYSISEECALATAGANEYEFYKNGRMFSDNDL